MIGLTEHGTMEPTVRTNITTGIGRWQGGLRQAGRAALAITATAMLLLSLVEVPGGLATGASPTRSPVLLIAAHP